MGFRKLFRTKTFESALNEIDHGEISSKTGLKRNLRLVDLTAMGIAAIIGAGIFSTIGNAAYNGGPAVSVLFIFTALACGFSALCYAHFASQIPVSGSAYTYAYVTFGEVVAWIIGWDLIMEYAVGNIAVAISWSDYFTGLLSGMGIDFPSYLSTDYLSASRGYEYVVSALQSGTAFESLSHPLQQAYNAWLNAPSVFNIKIIADIPAFSIVALITILVYMGIRESKIAGNIMVLIKLAILMLVLTIGAFYVNPDNWSPFAPNGIGGVLKGVSGVFFAYIGFDAISTTAEECKNPQRDLPRSMILSLLICTLLYVFISLVLTGMVSYNELNVGDPLAYVFEKLHLTKLSGVIAVSAVIAMAGVLLVFQIGQPRIWMSMSRDGLLPKRFSNLHPKYKTPAFSTIITGILVAIPSLFMNLTEVTDLTSIGTLFAFVLVCGGVLIQQSKQKEIPNHKNGYRIPYINSRIYMPFITTAIVILLLYYNLEGIKSFYIINTKENETFWSVFVHKIPLILYIITFVLITYFSIKKKWSLIPVLGLLTNLYLMTELGITNWLRFLIWLAMGLAIYFIYSINKSKLNN